MAGARPLTLVDVDREHHFPNGAGKMGWDEVVREVEAIEIICQRSGRESGWSTALACVDASPSPKGGHFSTDEYASVADVEPLVVSHGHASVAEVARVDGRRQAGKG